MINFNELINFVCINLIANPVSVILGIIIGVFLTFIINAILNYFLGGASEY